MKHCHCSDRSSEGALELRAASLPSHGDSSRNQPISKHHRNITVGILGGSISCGWGVGGPGVFGPSKASSYPQLLDTLPWLRVVNRAMRATGAMIPSLCLSAMLRNEEVDAVVLEYALNDGVLDGTGKSIAANQLVSISPEATMERLLRAIRLTFPRAVPIILYVCSPMLKANAKCEGMYSSVAAHYNVTELSIRRSSCPETAPCPRGSSCDGGFCCNLAWSDNATQDHPQSSGHVLIAQMIEQQLLSVAAQDVTDAVAVLPAPLLLDGVETGTYKCRMCTDRHLCRLLQPHHIDGFALEQAHGFRAYGSSQPALSTHKYGLSSRRENATISFDVPGRSNVMIAMLCSYEHMGAVALRIYPKAVQLTDIHAQRISLEWRNVSLTWRSKSSQQCFLELRTAEGAHVLEARVISQTGQVKIFGIFTQSRGPENDSRSKRRT